MPNYQDSIWLVNVLIIDIYFHSKVDRKKNSHSKAHFYFIERGKPSKYFAVGFWQEHSVALYSINEERSGVQKLCEEKIGTEFLPRSLLIVSLFLIFVRFKAQIETLRQHLRRRVICS